MATATSGALRSSPRSVDSVTLLPTDGSPETTIASTPCVAVSRTRTGTSNSLATLGARGSCVETTQAGGLTLTTPHAASGRRGRGQGDPRRCKEEDLGTGRHRGQRPTGVTSTLREVVSNAARCAVASRVWIVTPAIVRATHICPFEVTCAAPPSSCASGARVEGQRLAVRSLLFGSDKTHREFRRAAKWIQSRRVGTCAALGGTAPAWAFGAPAFDFARGGSCSPSPIVWPPCRLRG